MIKVVFVIQFNIIAVAISLAQPINFIKGPFEERACDVVEFNNFYIISGSVVTQDNYYSYLIKLGKDGKLLKDTVLFSKTLGKRVFVQDDQVLLFTVRGGDSITRCCYSFIVLDSMFNTILKKDLFLPLDVRSPGKFDIIFTTDSLYLIVGSTNDTGDSYLPNQNIIFYLISKYGDSLNSAYYQGDYSYWRSCYNVVQKDSAYVAFAKSINATGSGQLLVVDRNLKIIDTLEIGNELYEYYSPIIVNDSNYIICTLKQGDNRFFISKMLSDYSISKTIHFGGSNLLSVPASQESLSESGHQVFFLGIEGYVSVNPIYGLGKPSSLIVGSIDSDLNSLWTRTMGGDYYYFPYTIKATSDGGCILIGTINDTLNYMNTTTDIFVFKLDSNGQITYATNISPAEPFVSVFPNPASQQLNIHKSEDSDAIITIEIYNLSGVMVKSLESNSNVVDTDISELAAGTYLIKGFTKSGKQFQKKFIKTL